MSTKLDENVSEILRNPSYDPFTGNLSQSNSKLPPNIYYRSDTGVLLDRDGKEVTQWAEITHDNLTPEEKKNLVNNVKLSSSVSSDDIARYFTECLKGSTDKCSEFLSRSDFHESSYQAVNEMNPHVAFELLNKYGFTKIKIYNDYLKKDIDGMNNVQAWLASINNNPDINSDTKKNISSNTKLHVFLDLLVNKINNNPGILNTDVTGKISQIQINNGKINRYLPTIPPKYTDKPRSINEIFDSERKTPLTQSEMEHLLNALRLVLGNNFNFRVGPLNLNKIGGGNSNINQSGGFLTFKSRDLSHNSSAVLKSMYLNLSSALERANKKVSEPDHGKIMKLINEIDEKEKILKNSLNMIEKYIGVINSGVNDENTSNTLKAMEEFVNTRAKAARSISKRLELISLINGTMIGVLLRK